jgi:hypothetical protein
VVQRPFDVVQLALVSGASRWRTDLRRRIRSRSADPRADAVSNGRDLAMTFADVDTVENYRRDLDLTTATAHVSYMSGGVTFSREVFASAPAQVIVVRLTASRPGQISFTARMQTPQRRSRPPRTAT